MFFNFHKTIAALACLIIILAAYSPCAETSPQNPTKKIANMNDKELTDYLMEYVPEAYHRTYLMRGALTPLVTGKTTTIGKKSCRDIWLTMDGTTSTPIIKYTISPTGTVYEYDLAANSWIIADTQPFDLPLTPLLTVEQAMDILYENHMDTELFYPMELDKVEGNIIFYCFVYNDGDKYRYAYVNSITGEIEIVDEIKNYTGEQ